MNELVVHMEHKLILQGSLHLKVKYRDKARARRAVGLSFPGSAFASALTATSKSSKYGGRCHAVNKFTCTSQV